MRASLWYDASMRSMFLTVAVIGLVLAAVSGAMGFLVYPAKVRARHRVTGKKVPPPPRQGFWRAMFVIFVAAAFAGAFFGLLLPE